MSKRHKITVIVPVYNAEKYLKGCLRSLAGQTIRKRELEVLLVNDGSTDSSEAICGKFAARHRWARLITQPNGGPSAARNTGIKQAAGRYLMYLDADDQLSPDSVRAVRDFFAAHEDEVDIVTYPLVGERKGRRIPRHYRYSYITKTGVYDCNETPYFAQGSINVCVRNFGEDNILFEPDRFRHEDEAYVTANMARRWKFGYTTDAEYWYNKDNDGSIVATQFHAYYLFEENTAWFERLFAAYPGHVPFYLQGLLLNDVEWKLRGGLLFPWHYEGENFDRAAERLRALLRRVDAEMIAGHPRMSKGQKAFWQDFTRRDISKDDLPGAICQSIGGQAKLHARKRRPSKKRVWLYFDACPGGNAYLQLQHDCEKNDGVRRVYITGDSKGSIKHILAYLCCEWVLSSTLDFSPFTHQKLERLAEKYLLRWRMVYLQDGVHQFAGPDALMADKVVVSGPAEYECFRDTCGYQPEQLIPAGLARYDVMNHSAAPEGRVLFAPEWRRYLTHEGVAVRERVRDSDYYKNFYAFLSSPALASLLEEYRLTLDIHLHPNFLALLDLFAVECPRVRLVIRPEPAHYDACVTDISPIAYDFAYLGRYVQYFLPDGPQFRAGMHEVRVFGLPQVFGPHAETAGEALTQLREAAERNFAPKKEYLQRLQTFFYAFEDGREKVYQAIHPASAPP